MNIAKLLRNMEFEVRKHGTIIDLKALWIAELAQGCKNYSLNLKETGIWDYT